MGSPGMVETFSTRAMLESCRGRTGTTPFAVGLQHEDDRTNFQQGKNREAPVPTGRCNAIRLNHEAVILLMSASDDEEKAMEVLKLSLKYLKSDLASSTTSSPSSSWPSSSCKYQDDKHDRNDRQEVIPQRRAAHLIPMPQYSCGGDDQARIVSHPVFQSRQLDDDGFYLYSNAFTFDLSNFEDARCPPPLSSMIDTDILSATIIYNLAIALTTKAIRTNSSCLLQRSLRLYEMSIGLLNNIIMVPRTMMHPEGRSLSYEFAVNVAIACSNNLGQLAYRQGDYGRSQTMRGTMQYLLSLPLVENDSVGDESRLQRSPRIVFSETDMRGFKLNIMFIDPPTLAPMA